MASPEGIAPDKLFARFMAKVEVDEETACWNWQRAIDGNGYGRFRGWLHGEWRMLYAHRVAYSWFIGPIPDGLQIDHLCHNRRCVNPLHLEAVTQRENLRRGVRASKTHCDHGHPFNAANTYLKPNGTRQCRACSIRRSRESLARRKRT